jgi:hypothetical protein
LGRSVGQTENLHWRGDESIASDSIQRTGQVKSFDAEKARKAGQIPFVIELLLLCNIARDKPGAHPLKQSAARLDDAMRIRD